MNTSIEKDHQPIWLNSASLPEFPILTQDLDVDVCVVGGGIAGLTTAYLLTQQGKKVCVLEALDLAGGQTARTTAHFSYALDDRYFEIERIHGLRGARIAADSHKTAIEAVARMIQAENIDCEMERVDGYLFAQNDPKSHTLLKEIGAARRAGLSEVEFVNHAPIDSFDTGPCLLFPNQLQLHPLKYVSGLAQAIIAGGGQIFNHTHVTEVSGGKEATVKTSSGYTVHCQSIVVATNTPINDRVAIHTKQSAYRTYVIGIEVPKDSIPSILLWDTLDPYHYLRVEKGHRDRDILIVGGADHKTGQDSYPKGKFIELETWTRERFPNALEVVHQWSGQVMEPVDGMGFIGRNPMDSDNVYIITGDSGNGLTHGTLGAMLITDLILGRKNRWEELYEPSRISLKATSEHLKENANVAAQYADWISPKPKPNFEDIPRGEGIVYRDGVAMVAAYRDPDGHVELMSATCTHLAGVVNWNSVEKSWDCPCHGARFDRHGSVIEGPANRGLKKYEPVREDESSPTLTSPAFNLTSDIHT